MSKHLIAAADGSPDRALAAVAPWRRAVRLAPHPSGSPDDHRVTPDAR
jgi:hypothetical protein